MILFVDDDAHSRVASAEALRQRGFPVVEAVDGAHALRILETERPELLITELVMPNRDGIEVITAAKRDHPQMRIIAMTSRRHLGRLDLLQLASMIGADRTLDKPVAPGSLIMQVETFLSPPLGY